MPWMLKVLHGIIYANKEPLFLRLKIALKEVPKPYGANNSPQNEHLLTPKLSKIYLSLFLHRNTFGEM